MHFKAINGLFQSSAGTTPATANNDPVGYWHNNNGDSYNISQSTTDSRPLLQTALPSVLFDGTNDYLAYAGSTSTTVGTAIIVYKTGATAFSSRGAQVLLSSADTGSANNWFEIGISSAGKIYIESNAGGTKNTVTGLTILSVSTAYCVAVMYDGTDYYVSINGTEENPLIVSNVGTIAWLGNVSSPNNIVLGGTVTSAGLVRPFQGEILEAALYAIDISS